nr:hypothetical protein [Tanacetum cinerariifolium]
MLKKEKEGLDSKLTGFQSASKDLDTLLESQRSDKNNEGLGYSVVPPPPAQVHSPPKIDIKSYVSKNGESSESIISKPMIKFVKAADSPTGNSQNVIDDKGYWDSGCSQHMTGNISYLSDYEPYDGGTPRQHNMYSIDLNNVVPHSDLTCLVAKASADESMLWHRRLGHLNFKTMNRFTRTFFLKTKDETSGILRNFITEIENLKDLKAEAVNTACYVQNRVLENKSQNKTPYELFNGRAPTIGFLKPFGCHVMILNTLDHLGKFEAKGDEGYFIGYSMSSKAFRVFNKRTKRVEENLHVDFLKNKLIEKGAGPNWLFDIDTLTNSMNYVPMVSAGTTSTNFSESSSSNAQDACKANAPGSSGNSNPTATSTNPPADELETLTVETPIPTVSSPVPTAFLDDSLQLSRVRPIGTKWILKNKKDERGIVIRNKAKLVAQGYTQEEGIDYEEPPRFQDLEFSARVYKVEKEMYGLHQALRAWYVLQKKDGIFLSQDKYVGDILKKFRYSDVRSANTPMDKENPWGKDKTVKDVDLHLYRSIIRSLMYLTASRPDIMFAVCACARNQVTPNECHLYAVKRIFRYQKSHHKLGIWYTKDSSFDLMAYSDSDYGGATQDRKSTTGGCQFFGKRLISWQ